MGDSTVTPIFGSALAATSGRPRHSALVRITHWITTVCFLALLVSGVEILISHPRFYWGETGNVLTPPLFKIPIPASRSMVPTGYGYVLHDQNGWSRYLHFQSAWIVVLTGLLYLLWSLYSRHLQKNLVPNELSWKAIRSALSQHPAWSYNVLQRLAYLVVIFVLFPLIIWTGLAMSPGFTSAFPATVTTLGGQQSARTIHFIVTVALVLFLVVHIVMVFVAGFGSRMRAMITGRANMEGL